MKLPQSLLSLPLTLIIICITTNNSYAAYFSSLSDYTEEQLNQDLEDGFFVEEFTASSFIGDDGIADYELELTQEKITLDTEQFLWDNKEEVDFELSFDGSKLSYKVGDTTVQSIDLDYGEFDINGMLLTATSTKKSRVTISNLMVDDAYGSTEDLFSKKGNVDFLKITGLDNSFKLTGTQTFSWWGKRPSNMELAYEIRVGSFHDSVITANSDEVEVPEPSTISFLSIGAITLLIKIRRQKAS